MNLSFDSSALIPFLYGEHTEATRYEEMRQLFDFIQGGKVEGVISFYVFNELYEYVAITRLPDEVSDLFRISLLELLRFPLVIVPHLNRTDSNRLRRRFAIPDPYDAIHTACALFHDCDAIVTYDSHFDSVKNVIQVLSPQDVVTQLTHSTEDQ